MLLLFSIRIALGQDCSSGLLCMSFVNVYVFVCPSFPFGFEGGMWDLILFVPDHFTFYLLYVTNCTQVQSDQSLFLSPVPHCLNSHNTTKMAPGFIVLP